MEAESRGEGLVKCSKCGYENASGLKFCGKCGAKLGPNPSKGSLEGLAALHIAASLYLLLTVAFNSLVQASLLFIAPYMISGVAGLYLGYEFHRGKMGGRLKVASALTIAIGLSATSVLFIIGLYAQGVIGPAWILFLVNAWWLWGARNET